MSQGKTLQCVGADLRDDVFSHGQAYVIVSRVPAAHQFGVLVHPDRIVRRGDGTDLALMTNVVFPEPLARCVGVLTRRHQYHCQSCPCHRCCQQTFSSK